MVYAMALLCSNLGLCGNLTAIVSGFWISYVVALLSALDYVFP